MKTTYAAGVCGVLTAALFPCVGFAGAWVPFGPKTYTRGTGAPVTVTDTFTLLNPATQYTLKVFNGGLQPVQTALVSSSIVTLNGAQVIAENDLNQNTFEIDRPIRPLASNTISVQVRGGAGGVLAIEITGVDHDPPTITTTPSAPPNTAGWYNSPVTVNFNCSDKTSGVASCPAPITLSTEGANQVISGTATDLANSTAFAFSTVNLDMTPPKITASINPPPDAGGYNSGPVTVAFTCADALSGVASCPPPVSVTTEGSTTVAGATIDAAGNVANLAIVVNISDSYFKIRSWQTNPGGDPSQTGKCLDYGSSPSGASVFLNDCSAAHPIRVFELSPRIGSAGTQLSYEVMLFAGQYVVAIHNPFNNFGGGGSSLSPPQAPYSLELQVPFTSRLANLRTSNPANQVFRLDGDSIILEGLSVDPVTKLDVPGPCINTKGSTSLCSPPSQQFVIQVQNARGTNFSPLVAGMRNLSDNEFWDFVAQPGSRTYPTTGFISTAPTPCVQTGPIASAAALVCALSNAAWGNVVLVTSPINDCRVTDPPTQQTIDIGACIDMTGLGPLVVKAGVTVRGNRRGTRPGPQIYASYSQEASGDCDGNCIFDVVGDYARITGLHLRGQSRLPSLPSGTLSQNDAIAIYSAGYDNFANSVSASPSTSQLSTVTELIATIDHNEISDWITGAIRAHAPFTNNSSSPNQCTYLGFKDNQGGSYYNCDQNNQVVPYPGTYPFCNCGVFISNDPATLANIRVARNFVHHNSSSSTGYGVEMGNDGGRFLVEGNTFSWNRHDITGSGEPHSEYHALHNLVLAGAPDYGLFLGRLQDFDMHGTDNPQTYVGGAGGYYVEIDGNTFLGLDGHDYVLRGYPDNYPLLTNYTQYSRNVSERNQNDAIHFIDCITGIFCTYDYNSYPSRFPINIFANNQFGDSTPPYTNPASTVGVGDFDGDGDDDLFMATGNAWFFSPGGQREWRYLNSAPDTIGQLLLGDFDGDGRTDVVAMRNGALFVSWGGISAFDLLNPSPPATCTMADMAVGDFDGNGKPDIFCADGSTWWISYGGNTSFVPVIVADGTRVKDLRFGDFNSDGTTDVFGVVNGRFPSPQWQVRYGPKGYQGFLGGWQPLPVSMTTKPASADGLVVADFNGDGFADVGMACGVGGWRISYGAAKNWSTCSTWKVNTNLSRFTLANGAVGRFSGGPGADILLWNYYSVEGVGQPANLWDSPGGTGTLYQLSAPDVDMH